MVGADDYQKVDTLKTAASDASSVATSLELVGFRVVPAVQFNPTAQELEESWQAFLKELQPRDLAVVYFAGHGVQKDGVNYLLPVDFAPGDSMAGATRMDRWITDLGTRKVAQRVIILDACRNNPFGGKSTGLAAIENPAFGQNTYIIYATSPGRVAMDGMFARHFARELGKPGRIDDVFGRTAAAVLKDSKNAQSPFAINSGGLSMPHVTNPDRTEPLGLARADKCKEALPKLQAFVAIEPDDGAILAALGHCQIVESQPAAARRTLEKARGLTKLSPYVVQTELALAAFEDGDIFDARLRLRDPKNRPPADYVPARLLEGRILMKEEKFSEAVDIFNRLFETITPATAEARADRSRACTLLADALGLNGAHDAERTQRARCAELASEP